MRFWSLALVGAVAALPAVDKDLVDIGAGILASRQNDYSCAGATQKTPVVYLHGLFGNASDLDPLVPVFQSKGFCSFSLTYGAHVLGPTVGGLMHIRQSSEVIAAFVKDVKAKTGAEKVQFVGHSEGAFQVLYTTKFGGIADIVDHAVAVAPPTHGTDLNNLVDFINAFGPVVRAVIGVLLDIVGCPACNDLANGGPAVRRLNDGQPIAQPGVKYTIITSRNDDVVTPPAESSFVREQGVTNIFVQDYCPLDKPNHIEEMSDKNVQNLILNALTDNINATFPCDPKYY